jgi:hypothetical protein
MAVTPAWQPFFYVLSKVSLASGTMLRRLLGMANAFLASGTMLRRLLVRMGMIQTTRSTVRLCENL